jgi:D-serine deaminase-like pyridoxal phosphate-dependent protein
VTVDQKPNPFKIGDRVEFAPDAHAYGWTCHSFDRMRIKPGDSGVVTRIVKDVYLYLDDDRGGLNWECFKKTE